MRVVIAGGHGKIALRLEKLLAANGDVAVGIIRNVEHAAELRDVSAEPAVVDLEATTVDEVAEVLDGADVAVFAAGAGPGSGLARKETVDHAAAVLFADAAERAGVRRHVQVSAMGLDRADDPATDEVFAAYLRAKAAAEADLRSRDLEWTILRPGRLTDEPGTGMVHLTEHVEPGEVPRDDVAAVLMAVVADESVTVRRTLELTSGNTPIDEALGRL
ncbi:NAD(P)H-binding [Amycolatopsis arida]|uniref:NAD(P)H-binding n=1 Tax=Amycolatopsis arida TaxID=587909 RepID=A0A1I5TY49_9PSEU|nr:NAD(P)H-binding protein [Amycolatopsis arida]TDX95912.1 putative NAD(P)-binding protein [Amycolatopsis arida]SFP87992.1 NAD(P)H-binding [Amycolatopsis arida]